MDRKPVGREIFRTLQTGRGAHLVSYKTVTRSFPGVKRQVRGVDHPLFSAEVKERVEPSYVRWYQTCKEILYIFFWVFPRRQIVVGRRFGTLYHFHLQRLGVQCEV